MAEATTDKKIFSLLEVTRSIQKTLAARYQSAFWVKAEMNKLNFYSHSGHCYPELVEKKEGKVIALIRSNLWKTDYERVNAKFIRLMGEPLKDGIMILFLASIHFDPTHGLCLRIIDIDPSFSLGELEREKLESISRLREEGIFNLNKTKTLALLPQRIAVISVETSKGYSDYRKVIDNNPWGYQFLNILFPSLLQGDRSVESIIHQLNVIAKIHQHFDAVAIIRGGGGDVGLSSYNNYQLAKHIATFPIPVITGIGHSTNETVSEMISFYNAITPTELADFLIQKFHNFSAPVDRAREIILQRTRQLLQFEKNNLDSSIRHFQLATNTQVLRQYHRISQTLTTVKSNLKSFLTDQRHQLALTTQHIESRDPVNILRRGFSITTNSAGKPVTKISELALGDRMNTILADGTVTSEVLSSQQRPNE